MQDINPALLLSKCFAKKHHGKPARLLTRRAAWQDKLKANVHHITDGLAVGAVRGTGLSMVATFGSALWWTLHPAATLSLLPKMGVLVANSALLGTTVGALAGIVIAGGASFVAQKTKKYAGDLSGMSRRGLSGLAACLGFVAPLGVATVATIGVNNFASSPQRTIKAEPHVSKGAAGRLGIVHPFQVAVENKRGPDRKNNHPDKQNSPDKQNGQEEQRPTRRAVSHMFADAARARVKVITQNFSFTHRQYGGITLN